MSASEEKDKKIQSGNMHHSPRMIVDPVCIPVPLQQHSSIIRPTPRRPNEKASSSDRIGDASAKPKVEKRSMTDPRHPKAKTSSTSLAHPVKLRSKSPVQPGNEVPERDTGQEIQQQQNNHKGYVTNVQIVKPELNSKGTTRINVISEEPISNNGIVDMGFQILSSKDEEAEIDTANKIGGNLHHDHNKRPIAAQRNINKPSRKTAKNHGHSSKNQNGKSNHQVLTSSDGVNHLLDVKAAIERLKLHSPVDETSSHSSSDSSTSVGSDLEHNNKNVRASTSGSKLKKDHQNKYMSQETLNNSTVTSADEFVWIDSHNRLVELQQIPWNTADISQVVSKCLDINASSSNNKISADVYIRLSYYLQRVLVRLAREAQRLSKATGKCGTAEIGTSLKIVLSPSLATSTLRACLRSAAMFAISSDTSRQSKSQRAGLVLKVGRVQQWMCLVKVGKFIHTMAAVYLTASLETLIEELIAKCLENNHVSLNASLLEQVVGSNGDFWGMCQTYAHLSSSRLASGTLVLSPCIDAHINSSKLDGSKNNNMSKNSKQSTANVRQILLTTCVGSADELEEMVLIAGNIFQRMWQNASSGPTSGQRSLSSAGNLIGGLRMNLDWSPQAVKSLYHFMRCSQLEYVGQEGRTPIQELVYERPYIVLPPIMEWVRVVHAFAEHRHSCVIDEDDVLQAARILLPGMDCPPRAILNLNPPSLSMSDELQCMNEIKKNMAFQMLTSGRRDLVPHALQMLPPNCLKLGFCNSQSGLTPLQWAALKGDVNVCKILLDTGAAVDGKSETQASNTSNSSVIGALPLRGGGRQPQEWTPLCYAAIGGHYKVARYLLERGANADAGSTDEICSETPLQLASGAGNVRMVELLMANGASPFKSTSPESGALGLPSTGQAGNPSPVAVAAIHGHRRLLHIMITHCLAFNRSREQVHQDEDDNEVLSLAEILAEGVNDHHAEDKNKSNMGNTIKNFTKAQIRKLQEAMYHSSECANIELTLDLRNLGVPWTPYTWVQTLRLAHDNQIIPMVNELLQDFTSDWIDDHSRSFLADTALPLLFHIFRTCKNEGSILILADIFALCCSNGQGGNHRIELQVSSTSNDFKDTPPRIDARFVNNPELSDVQFRVEGRIFYAHKLALISASPRFQSMLNSRFCQQQNLENCGSVNSNSSNNSNSNSSVLQINDIRYDIFHLVMTYLYNGGGLNQLQVEPTDVLELMAAANFFQLPGLLRYCEMLCSKLVELDNIVSYYIHAKVYSALDLLEYCETFLLKNLVALLTYDDSVKRLVFGKKLQNHDVLGGLLLNVQKRVRGK